MPIEPRAVDVPSLYPAAPYAYAAVAPGGIVFTAGACPLDADGRVVGVGDPEAQARKALDNLEAALAAAGATLRQVVKTTVFVVGVERADLVRVFRVVEARFGAWRPPSTLLGVALLGYPDQLVEIEAVAVMA